MNILILQERKLEKHRLLCKSFPSPEGRGGSHNSGCKQKFTSLEEWKFGRFSKAPLQIYGKGEEWLGEETPNSQATEKRFWRSVELPSSSAKSSRVAAFMGHHPSWGGLIGGATVFSATPDPVSYPQPYSR